MEPQKQNNCDYLLDHMNENRMSIYTILFVNKFQILAQIEQMFDMNNLQNLLDADQNDNNQNTQLKMGQIENEQKVFSFSSNRKQFIQGSGLLRDHEKLLNTLFEKGDIVKREKGEMGLNVHSKNRKQSHRKLNVFKQAQLDKKVNNSLLFIQNFKTKHKAGSRDYLICQRADFCISIGYFDKEDYRVAKTLVIDSRVTCILYIQEEYENLIMHGNTVDDKLIIGTAHGIIYMIESFTRKIHMESYVLQIKKEQILSQKGDQIKYLFNINQNRLTFYAFTPTQIKRFDYTMIHTKEKDSKSQEPTHKVFTYLQLQSTSYSHQIQFICSTTINFPTALSKNCCLFYSQSTNLLCILDDQQTSIWVPDRLANLSRAYSTFVANFLVDLDPIPDIVCVQHSQPKNQIIIAAKGGLIFFYKVIILSEIGDYMKNKMSPNFSFILEKQLCIKQQSEILSLDMMEGLLCISTEEKVLFYDIEQRGKFSQTLKQKEKSIINKVMWIGDNLVLSCMSPNQGRVYLYSNQLPVKRRQ